MPDYALMNQHLYEGKAKEVEQMTRDALAEGRPVQEVLTDGLIAGMSVVGEDFKHNVLYVPEVLIAARAMKAGMAVLKPLLSAKDSGTPAVGVLLMGTVRGDLHDIGKNLVCMMAEGAGFEVHDIGVDQSVEKFMAAADKCQPTIIGMSALLTTTMTYMKTVIDGFEQAGKGHIKMAVGGAPISRCLPTRSAPTATARTPQPRSTCSCGWRNKLPLRRFLRDVRDPSRAFHR
jgi:5-methyltetrahydrofolate--homocysteine methyltransferase